MLQQELNSELQKLDEAIVWARSGLEHAPEGRLLVSLINNTPRYYYRKTPQDKTGSYLGSGNEDLIASLAQKDYETKLLKVAERRKAKLIKAQKLCDEVEGQEDVLAAVYSGLPEPRKKHVTPFALNDEDYALQWQSREYAGNSHPFGACSLFTRRGERVRSKSEILIADALYSANVPYHYECPVFIGGYSSIYPDFTVLNKRTRHEYLWEHFGGLDDPDYRERMVQRINRYALSGYFMGDKLIATYETAETPLDTRVVNELIRQFLL